MTAGKSAAMTGIFADSILDTRRICLKTKLQDHVLKPQMAEFLKKAFCVGGGETGCIYNQLQF